MVNVEMKLFFIGLLSGIVGGMGIGGGTILIPFLVLFTTLTQQEAQGINLLVFIPVSVIAIITHFINKNIELKLAAFLVISGIIGSFIGSILAVNIDSNLLRKLFSILLLGVGIYELFSKKK